MSEARKFFELSCIDTETQTQDTANTVSMELPVPSYSTLPSSELGTWEELASQYGKFVNQQAGVVYTRRPRRPAIDKKDLTQEGLIALMHSAELYDPTQNASYLTYAAKAMRYNMGRHYQQVAFPIHIPQYQQYALYNLEIENATKLQQQQTPLTSTEIANFIGVVADERPSYMRNGNDNHVTVGDVMLAKEIAWHMQSLEEVIESQDDLEIASHIPEEKTNIHSVTQRSSSEPLETTLIRKELCEALQKTIAATDLDAQEQVIIRQFYPLDPLTSPKTLPEIGEQLGFTKQRAHQIKQKAITKLRETANTQQLGLYLDTLI